MNRCDYVDPSLAWTDVKDIGRGASMSRLGFEALTRPKSFHLRIEPTTESTTWQFKPPAPGIFPHASSPAPGVLPSFPG
jgi:hypothetical protein